MTTSSLPTTTPSDEHEGGSLLLAGLAIPFMLATAIICAGLIVGGGIGLTIAYGGFFVLVLGVAAGIFAFINTDSGH